MPRINPIGLQYIFCEGFVFPSQTGAQRKRASQHHAGISLQTGPNLQGWGVAEYRNNPFLI
jgi:hypothetical protein